MFGTLLGGLEWVGRFSDPLAVLVLAAFLVGGVLAVLDRRGARPVTVVAWVLFGAFWFSLIHHFAFVQKSFVEGLGVVVAVPGSLYAGLLLARGRDSLFVLSRAIGLMGLVYFPFIAVDPLGTWLIETVTRQTELLMGLVGQHSPGDYRVVTDGPMGRETARDTFVFHAPSGHRITYTILVACTGAGSIAIFVGGILAVAAPLRHKARALAVSVPLIYALNLVRNVFIGLSFGQQRMHLFPEAVLALFGSEDPYRVSYFVADRILAQTASVVALVAITYLVVRELPEILVLLEDALFVATGREYDLRGTLDFDARRPPPPASADD